MERLRAETALVEAQLAAPAALLPAATSLPDLVSPPACDCEGTLLLECQRLLSEHTNSVHALMKTYVTRIDELEGLVAAHRVNTDAVARDVAPDPAPRALVEPKSPGTPTGPADELRKSAPWRTLLQTDSDKFCSMDELYAVQQDAAAAVTRMLATNFECAKCLIPCGSAENAVGCAMACVKQVPPKRV
jgi:hypothetical protein